MCENKRTIIVYVCEFTYFMDRFYILKHYNNNNNNKFRHFSKSMTVQFTAPQIFVAIKKIELVVTSSDIPLY